ncbi:MAG: imidazole glycerol phosphate synthase subunit HisH, partial [Pyrinomonadaceae bacterium]
MTSKVTIIDCGTGNLNSVKRSLDILGISSKITSDPLDIGDAEKIILPGVGHFGKAMANLKRLKLIEPLEQAVLLDRRPILGICLGMELMAKKSEEGNALGLGWIDAEIVRFNISNKERYKVPHIGWNQIKIVRNSALLKDVPDGSEFYFLHSFHLKINDPSVLISESRYEVKFA